MWDAVMAEVGLLLDRWVGMVVAKRVVSGWSHSLGGRRAGTRVTVVGEVTGEKGTAAARSVVGSGRLLGSKAG